MAADLLIKCVKKLLASGGAGKGGAMVEGASEAAEIQESLRCAIEGNSHAVEQINNAGGRLAHALHRGLVGEEVAAVNGVIKMLPGGVAFAFEVLGGVNPTLGAHGMRALDGNNGEEINVAALFGNLNHSGKPGQTSAYNDNFRIRCPCHFSFARVLYL